MIDLLFKYGSILAPVLVGLYAGLLGLLATSSLQAHVVYLHKIQMIDEVKHTSRSDLGAAVSVMEWRTKNGVTREAFLKTGLHGVVMGNPVITMAVMRIFEAANSSFNDAKEEKVYSR